jgi:ubiquinone/menaquinone biosynthesis C-methylase UbiE
MALNDRARAIAGDWESHTYYEEAEAWTHFFWDDDSVFRQFFDRLDLSRIAEIACGRGRHAARIVDGAGKLYLVDVVQANIQACQARFQGKHQIDYIVTPGDSLAGIPDQSLTAVFCYDAMVHFEAETMISYIAEIQRVLAPGGRALLHYSNLHWLPGLEYGQGPHMRNFFSEAMMIHFASRKGMHCLDSRTLAWGSEPTYHALDALTLLQRS